MLAYSARRLGQTLVLVAIVATLVFLLLRLLGGDPATIVGMPGSSQAVIDGYREEFGLDRSIPAQYGLFVANAVQGDFGTSFRVGAPAMPLVLDALARTGLLVALALALSLVLSVSAALVSAWRPGSWFDRGVGLVASFLQALPVFWLGILLVLVFSVQLGLFPALATPTAKGLVLPVIAVAAGLFPEQYRLLRTSATKALGEDYVRSARGFGFSERTVLLRHVLKNSVLPLLTVLGIQLGYLLGGAIAVEVVFDYPGIGTLAQQALLSRDFPIIQAITIVAATAFMVINLGVDLLYGVLNRRVVL